MFTLQSKTCTGTLVGFANRGRNNCTYPSDRHAVLAWKEHLLANHLVNDSDAFAKKKLMSLRSSYCSVCFDKGKHEAELEKDLEEEGILVTNLTIRSSNPALIQENRPRPARSWLGTKFLQCRIVTSYIKNEGKLFSFLIQNGP